MYIAVTLWNMNNGIITEVKHNDQVFVLKTDEPSDCAKPVENLIDTPPLVFKQKNPTDPPIVDISPRKPYTRNVKKSYLEKWVTKGIFDVFTLEQFFEQHPKQKRNDSLNRHIMGLVDKKMITQIDKTKFRVNRDG